MTAAITAQRRGDLEAAEAGYRSALAQGVLHPILFSNLATVLRCTRRIEEAEELLREAIRSAPHFSDAYINLGNLLRERGALVEACDCLNRALELQPARVEALVSLGIVRQAQNQLVEAQMLVDRALQIQPDHVDALVLLAGLQMWRMNNEQAMRVVRRALQIEPGHLEGLITLAQILEQLGKPDEAMIVWQKAAALGPQHASALLGLAEMWMREDGEEALRQARQLIERVLAWGQGSGEALAAHANLLIREGDSQQAIGAMQAAVAADPENLGFQAITRKSLGILLFSMGTFTQTAWEYYEARWDSPGMEAFRYAHLPRWDGSRLKGHLLVVREQGLGDEVLFLGMLRELMAAGHRLVVEVSSRLLPLLRPCLPDATLVATVTPLDTLDIDAVVPLGSVGMHCANDASSFAFRKEPYLKATPAPGLIEKLSEEQSKKLKVGLVWRSNNIQRGFRKSLGLEDLLPLTRLNTTCFISLQHDALSKEEQETLETSGIFCPESDFFNDLEALSRWINFCDVVLTVSTSTAHIACALGAHTWILLPSRQIPHWYWGMEGERTPWYPSARLLRQPHRGDWAGLIEQVGLDLQALADHQLAISQVVTSVKS